MGVVGTFIPHAACDDEHGEGKDGSKNSTAHISGFTIALLDWVLLWVHNLFVKH